MKKFNTFSACIHYVFVIARLIMKGLEYWIPKDKLSIDSIPLKICLNNTFELEEYERFRPYMVQEHDHRFDTL